MAAVGSRWSGEPATEKLGVMIGGSTELPLSYDSCFRPVRSSNLLHSYDIERVPHGEGKGLSVR